MHIIDRRLNASGKSLPNRQRFLRRVRGEVQRAVHDISRTRQIRNLEAEAEIRIPATGVGEPSFRREGGTGMRSIILPGNKHFVEGDTIERPGGGDGGGSGSEGSPDGAGEDSFRFVLTKEEFLDIFLEDLELPDMSKRRMAMIATDAPRRAGYAIAGSPARLAISRTMRNSLSRRVALGRPDPAEVAELEDQIAKAEAAGETPEMIATRRSALAQLQARLLRIPFIDPIDLRYRRYESVPKPMAQAVMFCLMDVSGSMTEHMKDLAKRFFMLLYVFLSRRYDNVAVVFIRHTHEASEVDEETFFRSTETGGTIVSSALVKMEEIIAERFPAADWNIYTAQASDGDNSPGDHATTQDVLARVLPLCQHFSYIEVAEPLEAPNGYAPHQTSLWRSFSELDASADNLAMRKVSQPSEIYPVFRDLFLKRDAEAHPTAGVST